MFPTFTPVPPTFEAFMAANDLTADHPNLDGWRELWRRELDIASQAPAVIPPCPPWCLLDQGHEYDSTDGHGDDVTFERQHVAFDGEVADVSALEHNRAGTVTVDEPGIYLSLRDDERPAEEVRAIAAELLNAADVLDGVTR
jgi:hypothetical protein